MPFKYLRTDNFWKVFLFANLFFTLSFALIRLPIILSNPDSFRATDGRKLHPWWDALLISVHHQSTIGDSNIEAVSGWAITLSLLQGFSVFLVYGLALVALVRN